MHICCSLSIVLVYLLSSACQKDSTDYLSSNAIVLDNPRNLSNKAIKALDEYDAILIGKVHGNYECADLLYGIAKKFASKGEIVLAGFEVPADQVEGLGSGLTLDQIAQTSFFSDDYQDGRGSVKWATTLLELQALQNVELVLFDNTTEEWIDGYWRDRRDSLMMAKINTAILVHKPTKLVTITGNAHNQLVPLWSDHSMGNYLANHPTSLLRGRKVLSLIHVHNGGTAMNNSGNGLEFRDMGAAEDNIFTAFGADNYIVTYGDKVAIRTYPEMVSWQIDVYDGMYFTKHLSAAKPFEK